MPTLNVQAFQFPVFSIHLSSLPISVQWTRFPFAHGQKRFLFIRLNYFLWQSPNHKSNINSAKWIVVSRDVKIIKKLFKLKCQSNYKTQMNWFCGHLKYILLFVYSAFQHFFISIKEWVRTNERAPVSFS